MNCVATCNFRKTGLLIFALYLLPAVVCAAGAPDHVTGRLLAIPRHEVDVTQLARVLTLHGAKIHKQLSPLGLQILDVPEEASAAAMEGLKQSGMFEIVERDYYAHTAATSAVIPNDPSYVNQWYLPQISAPQAWAITTGTASIVVAVIDSGADGTHPDLAGKLAPGWNFLTNNANTSDAVGHGTAVAGIIGAASNNNGGIAGVSWNSQIMPLVVVDATEYASYSNIAAAIQYAVDNGAKVINISLGGTSASSTLQSAVDYAWSHNVVVFAPAMNDSSSSPNYPAACNHAVAVSATDSTDSIATYSNYGGWIALSAPGSNIFTTTMGGGYGYWYGTSFASPIAAGVAALALSVNPSLTAQAMVTLLEQNTDDLGTAGFDPYYGWGRVNAYKAATAALPPAAVTVTPNTASLNAGQSQQFTATVTGATNTAVSWSINPALGTISASGIYTAPASLTVSQKVTVTALAAGGASASGSVTLVPVVITTAPLTANLNAGQTKQFSATVTGSSNTAVSWSVNPAVGAISSSGLYTAPASVTSAQTISVIATGLGGVTATSTVSLAPIAVASAPQTATLNAGQTQQFTATVNGSSTAVVTWSLTPATGSISTAGLYTAPASVSSVQTVTVTASVAGGASASSLSHSSLFP